MDGEAEARAVEVREAMEWGARYRPRSRAVLQDLAGTGVELLAAGEAASGVVAPEVRFFGATDVLIAKMGCALISPEFPDRMIDRFVVELLSAVGGALADLHEAAEQALRGEIAAASPRNPFLSDSEGLAALFGEVRRLLAEERSAEAVELARTYCAAHPDEAKARRALAAALYRALPEAGRARRAELGALLDGEAALEPSVLIAALRELVALVPGLGWLHINLARALLAAGDRAGCLETLAAAGRALPWDPDIEVEVARIAFEHDRDPAPVVRLVAPVLERAPAHVPGRVLAAQACALKGDHREAVEHLEVALARDPWSGDALGLLALVACGCWLEEAGEDAGEWLSLARVEHALEKAMAMEGAGWAEVAWDLAKLAFLIDRERPELATSRLLHVGPRIGVPRMFDEIVQADDEPTLCGVVWPRAGLMFLRRCEWESCYQWQSRVAERFPGVKPGHVRNDMAYALVQLGRDQGRALELARAAVSILREEQPDEQGLDWACFLDTLGVALLACGETGEAREVLERTVAMSGHDLLHKWHLAEALWRDGERDRARRLLATLAAREPCRLEDQQVLERIRAANADPEKLWR